MAGHPAFSYEVEGELPPAGRLVRPVSAVTGAGREGPAGVDRTADSAGSPRRNRGSPGTPEGEVPASAAMDDGAAGRHVTYRPAPTGARSFVVTRNEAGFVVKGKAVRRLVSRFDLDNEEATQYLAERLDRLGVYAALKARGARPGDEVDLEGYAFEFQ